MKLSVIALFTLMSFLSFSQNLKFKIEGQKDTTIYLVKYYGSKMYYADTAVIKKGVVEFNGKKQSPGILAVLLPNQKFFEFVYNNEEVYIETKAPDFVENMVVKKSAENKVFLEYINFISSNKKEAAKLADLKAKTAPTDPMNKVYSQKLDSINKAVVTYQQNLIAKNHTLLIAKIIKMSMDVEVPEAPKDANGKVIDSAFRYHYFMQHYWDNTDLKDDRLVNTPIFQNKLEFYFGKNMMIQHWDTILYHAVGMCDTLNPKSKMFEFCVSWITSTYGKSNIMGMDKVYVMMADRYYCSKNAEGNSPAFWMSKEKLDDLCEKIQVQKHLVMGVVPPNIILPDSTNKPLDQLNWINMYKLNSEYTVLYFWDPECGHCKKITPKLAELYTKKLKERNVEVYAVGKAVGADYEKWKKFIRDNNMTFINVAVTDALYKAAMADARQFIPKYTTLESLNYQQSYDIYATPRVFVLDKDKKIIAKSISISQLEDLLDRLQGHEKDPKLFPPDPEEDEQMN